MFHCLYSPHLLDPFLCDGHLGSFHVLAVVHSAAVDVEVHVSFQTMFFSGYIIFLWIYNFPRGSDGKESACSAGDLGAMPGLGRSLGEGNGNPLQYSCLENPMDRGGWWAAVHEIAELDMTEVTNTFTSLSFSRRQKTCTVKTRRYWWKKLKLTETDGKICVLD